MKQLDLLRVLAVTAAALLTACNRTSSQGAGSSFKFYSDNLRSYGDGVYDLTLVPRAVAGDANLVNKGLTLGDRLQYRLAYFRVMYQRDTPGDEGRVVQTRYVGDMQVSAQKLLANRIPIGVLAQGPQLTDGAYAAVLCYNLTDCAAPSVETLTAYKDKVQSGTCGDINKSGALDESCAVTLVSDIARDYPLLGVAYPLTVRGGRFVSGDNSLVYVARKPSSLALTDGNANGRASFGLAEAACSDQLATMSPRLGGFNARMLDSDLCPDSNASGSTDAAAAANQAMGQFNGSASSVLDGGAPNPGQTTANSRRGPGGAVVSSSNVVMIDPNTPGLQEWLANGGRMRFPPDCFLEGTKVAVAIQEGGRLTLVERPIEEIREGDLVYNPLLRRAYPVRKTDRDERSGEPYYEIATSQTPSLKVTSIHPFVTPEGYTSAELLSKKWSQNQKINVLATRNLPVRERADLTWVEVTSISAVPSAKSYKVFNLEVDMQRPVSFPGDNSWVFPMTTGSGSQCEDPSCSEFYLSSNRLVTGDLSRQKLLQEMLQQSMSGLNGRFARTFETTAK